MRIGIDARFFRKSTGGIGRYTRALIRELAKIDKVNEYIVYITPEDEKEYDELTQNLLVSPSQGGKLKTKNFQKKVIPITHYSMSEQTKLLRILQEDKLDLVHFTNFNHPLFYKGRFVVTIHDLTLMIYPSTKVKQSVVKKFGLKMTMNNAVKKAQKVIAVSEATKKDIVNVLNAKQDKIKVIYEGIDDEYQKSSVISRQLSVKYGIKKPYLLFISQWRPHKGIIQLVEAFEILKNKYKIPHQLVIVGKPNKDFPEIAEAIKKSSASKDIITPGFIAEEDLPGLYREASAFVFPSHYEGFGLPPLEAMASGVPVVASKVSCMPEILGDAAFYFDPYDPEDMAKQINKVLENAPLRRMMLKKGFHQIKKYSWSKMAEQTLEVYQKVLST